MINGMMKIVRVRSILREKLDMVFPLNRLDDVAAPLVPDPAKDDPKHTANDAGHPIVGMRKMQEPQIGKGVPEYGKPECTQITDNRPFCSFLFLAMRVSFETLFLLMMIS